MQKTQTHTAERKGNKEGGHPMDRIFIAEDDQKIREELQVLLEKYGYHCLAAQTFDDLADQILLENPDLLVLDLNLPRYDGFAICREIRSRSEMPILVVTSRDSELDELMAMNLGADDFIAKPYNVQILLAHIAALLRRTYRQNQSVCLEYRGLSLDLSKSCARFGEREVLLTKNEQQILQLLIQNAGEVVAREDLMNALWQSDTFIDDNTLTVNVNRLRKKLNALGLSGFLTTRRGLGYQL